MGHIWDVMLVEPGAVLKDDMVIGPGDVGYEFWHKHLHKQGSCLPTQTVIVRRLCREPVVYEEPKPPWWKFWAR